MLALALSLMLLALSGSQFMQAIERKAYDWGVQFSQREAGDKVAIIAIDDQSIKNIGRWPWPRNVHAQVLASLKSAKVVGNTIFYLEPQLDPGLAYINQIDQLVSKSAFLGSSDGVALQSLVHQAQNALNTDAQLALSMQSANNVVLGMPFVIGTPQGNPDAPLPDYITKFAIQPVGDTALAEEDGLLPTPALAATPPIASIARHARAIGHLNSNPDIDGAIRVEPLVLQYYDQYYPSMALQIAASYLNLTTKDIQIRLGQGIQMGNVQIATDAALQMNSFFYADKRGEPPFKIDSFYDVYSGKIPSAKYQGKIVLIGMAASGDGSDMQVTPISASMPPITTLAHHVASILNEDFFISPPWATAFELLAWLLVSVYLIGLLPKLNAQHATWFTVGIALTLLVTHFVLMTQQGWWVQLMMPLLLLIVGHTLISTKRYLITEQSKTKADAESSDSNKNLALMLQSQGQLDMAFDRFRKCTLNDALMDALYSLGLDFERKRQFNKAEAVFAYMANHNAHYKDLAQRISSAKRLSETLILGSRGAQPSNLLSNNPALEKPMLGRYQVEKELGKGAMGTVYLGVDPKIGRQVAIKTLALSQEFEASELEAVKSRFFREAETAGKLNHPNIVTIYDAGEEHDLAYIAMELLKGHDLNAYTKKDRLLPVNHVLNIIIKVAEALDYAHLQHVIHRDIKPANIMYEPDTQSVKVTDFGIARITDTSKTKTGMVLGTPNFMSPEQLSGKKLDGRSDLFSLGTTLYQLLTGELPFVGDSMANLMFNISQSTPKPMTDIVPVLPIALSATVNQLLEKDAANRFTNGRSLATALRNVLATLESNSTSS
jgi:serine/threonine-protein kinase